MSESADEMLKRFERENEERLRPEREWRQRWLVLELFIKLFLLGLAISLSVVLFYFIESYLK